MSRAVVGGGHTEADVEYASYYANLASSTKPPPFITPKNGSGSTAVTPWSGHGASNLTIDASVANRSVLRLSPSSHTYSGGAQYSYGAIGETLSGGAVTHSVPNSSNAQQSWERTTTPGVPTASVSIP